MVAPNGARRNKSDHQQLPMTAGELAQTAKSVVAAGATALHLHVRDADGKHSLDVDLYRQAITAIRDVCGQDLLLQVTTEAAGIYVVQQQIEMVYQLQPQAVSLSVRELAAATRHDISALDRWMREHRVLPQWILYSDADLQLYKNWLTEAVLCGSAYPVLFVLGNYGKKIIAEIDMLDPFISPELSTPGSASRSTTIFSSWMVCAFGYNEQAIMKTVIAKGGHMRVGFENNIQRPDRMPVKDNAELVDNSVAAVKKQGMSMANVELTQQILTPLW